MKRMHLARLGALYVSLICLILLCSCVSQPRSNQMVPSGLKVGQTSDASVIVTTDKEIVSKRWSRYSDGEPLGKGITDDAFTEAVALALTKSGMFSKVVSTGPADYTLTVSVLEEQFFGACLVFARWKLTNNADGCVILDREVSGENFFATGKIGNSFTIMTVAAERAAQRNIEEGLMLINELDLGRK